MSQEISLWQEIDILPDLGVLDDLLKDLLDKSYQLVLGGLSKKKQQEILDPLREQSGQ